VEVAQKAQVEKLEDEGRRAGGWFLWMFTGWWFGTWLLYAFMTFHILGISWNFIIPTDELIFFQRC
jgi:hypothetical protein